jgi:TonB-linked SusC/RagA family outer membrane protein
MTQKPLPVLRNTLVEFLMGLFLLCSMQANAEKMLSIKVTGIVVDQADQPLVGVNVIEKGTINGTVTDSDGKFTLAVENEKSVLVISYIGYTVQEKTVNNLTKIDIKLIPETATLGEIVVVGYGTSRKQDVITSITSVKPEALTRNASLDIGEMMRGKVAGVYITTNDAGPGGSSKIQIRGQSSLSAGSDPLVIADGIQIGSINDINPADIESMDILKDAAAQAIYGARAANGVVLITTKRGKTGKLTVNYDGYFGTQTAKRNFDVYTGQEFAQLKREADRAVNGNIMRADALIFSADELAAIAENRSIDWSGEVLKSATIQNHNISFSAGSEKTKLYFGTNYQNMTGIVPTTRINRTTVRLNLDQTLTKWLKVGVNTSFQLAISSDPDVAGIVRQVVTASPLGNIYNPDGSYNVRPGGNQESFNPLLNLNEIDNSKNARNDIVNVFADISPMKGFNNRINLSRRSWNNKELNYNSRLSESGVVNGAANGSIYFQENAEWQLENITSYKTSIRDHNLNFTLVESAIESNYYDFRNSSSQIPNDILGIYGLTSALVNVPTIGGNRRRLLSIAARAEYDYQSKYSIGITARADGSSVFGSENKWGYFPAVALGWTLSKENFLANVKAISFLKLRASYGSVGNQAIAPYGSLALSNQVDYLFGADRVSGFSPGSQLANPTLKWETSTTFNAGADFELFNGRLNGSVDVYDKRTTDMLVYRQLNSSIGYSNQPDNIGEVQNKGIELSLDGVLLRKNDLTIKAGGMFTMNKNAIISLYGDLNNDGIQDDDVANNWFVGQPISIYRQPKYLGVWQGTEVYPGSTFNPATGKWEIGGVQAPVAVNEATAQPLKDPFTNATPKPGTPKIEDVNNDGKIDAADSRITSQNPKWIGSFNLNASYKGFDFSMDVYTVQGIIRNNQFLYDYTAGGDLRGNRNGIKVDYWTPENPASLYPQPNAGTSPPGMFNIGLQDASFWRLQNITIGYKLPSNLISKIKLSKARVYVTAQNLITKTNYQAYSPEQDLYAYPMTRNLIFGLSLSL